MNTKIELLKARINLLQHRDPTMNANIINKCWRKIRLLEGK